MSTPNTEFCFLNTIPYSKKPELIREMAHFKFGARDNMSKGLIEIEDKETLKRLTGACQRTQDPTQWGFHCPKFVAI